jgi:3'-phosphoadenosine 5'-phosphosulfate sulfotransferase (PAPS reductase)/FAD synthetase
MLDMVVPKKQVTLQSDWERALAAIRAGDYPAERLDRLIDRTVSDIRLRTRERRVAYAWSGGKDSIALRHVMELAGITDCVLGMCNLEYPAFLQWITENMPLGLTVINTGQDIEWLARHPEMLFPDTAPIAAKWFKMVQHTAQERYFASENLDMLALGRRKADGNFVGKGNIYTNAAGITRYSPIAQWGHIDVLALVERIGITWPPIYSWPRGFQCGTHAWAARQWTGSIGNGWREVHAIDASIVVEAAPYFASAARCLETL